MLGIQPSAIQQRDCPVGKVEGPDPTGTGAWSPWLGPREATPGICRERAHTGKTLNLCSLFGAWFPRPVSRMHHKQAVPEDVFQG